MTLDVTRGGYLGFQRSNTAATEHGALAFMVRSLLARVQTATLVQVISVTNEGEASAVGFVDIQPMVSQASGSGVAVPHGTIFRCPYLRVQGGVSAVILDPVAGDIGIAVFASRDISSVIATRRPANQGSKRRFDMADGLYLGGVINGEPTQWVRFSADGVEIKSPTQVRLSAPDVAIACSTLEIAASTSVSITTPILTINGAATVNGAVEVAGAATFTGGIFDRGTDIGAAHQHGGVETGPARTSGVV